MSGSRQRSVETRLEEKRDALSTAHTGGGHAVAQATAPTDVHTND